MKTYRITEKEIEGLEPVAVGYKIFKNDFTTKQGNYDYKDENGNVVGTIHKCDGDIKECQWGLHFSKFPHDCFNFYEPLQWHKFAKVEAYGDLIEGNKKCVTNILKIVQVYTFEEFINLIQKVLSEASQSYGVNVSRGVNESDGVNGSRGVSRSYGVNGSDGVSVSRGVNVSDGVNGSYGILKCEGISRSIFCYKKSGKLLAFNKKITESRFNDIYNKLRSFGWLPRFNNAEQLKGDLEWYETNIKAIVAVDNKTAWSFMPSEMKDYIKGLPEYNEQIFNKIVGDIEE